MDLFKNRAALFASALLTVAPSIAAQSKSTDVPGVCTQDGETRFDPACYVRIYEDNGKGKRQLLYGRDQMLNSRLLRVDPESTIVIDLASAFAGDQHGDVALNKLLVKAELKKKDASHAVEVTGYSQIGESANDKSSQIAFAFQTFDNVAGKVENLYFTSRDLIEKTFGSECYNLLKSGDAGTATCIVDDDKLDRFTAGLEVFEPEVVALADFFSSPGNRAVQAQIAADIFEIDVESLQGIAAQIKTQRSKLHDADIVSNPGLRQKIVGILLERTELAVRDLSGVIHATEKIACAVTNNADDRKRQGCDIDLAQICPSRYDSDRKRNLVLGLEDPAEFARDCLKEFKRKDYLKALKKYLVEGAIDLARNSAESGDLLILTLEGQGPDQAAGETGARAEFRIRISNYGWKAGVEPSLFFIKRIGVNEVDQNRPAASPVKTLLPVRFAPYPGVSLTASYHGTHGGGASFLHYVAPGFGVNATFMTFGAMRDFDPLANTGAGQFTTVNGSSVELGVGPVFTLFGNRISATYGWNLMAADRRTYWALGFGFLSLGKDLAGFIKKN